jgi:hypothetical protein
MTELSAANTVACQTEHFCCVQKPPGSTATLSISAILESVWISATNFDVSISYRRRDIPKSTGVMLVELMPGLYGLGLFWTQNPF